MIDELRFCPSLELLGRFVANHSFVYFILGQSLGLSFADILILYGRAVGIITRNDCAMSFQIGTLKNFPIAACLIDTVGDQHCISATRRQHPLRIHILTDVCNDTLDTLFATEKFFHLGPTRLQLSTCDTAQSRRLRIEPFVDFLSFA